MRTNIVIDDRLMAEAMKWSGAATKRQAVEDSLRLMVRIRREERVRALRGKVPWQGDLGAMQRDRVGETWMGGRTVALALARNYGLLRRRGVTVRKTVDMLVGTYCLMNCHELRHNDRDFDLLAEHRGLRTVPA